MIDGLTLTQSLPIMEYLEESRPDINPLLPGDPKDRVRGEMIFFTFDFELGLIFYHAIGELGVVIWIKRDLHNVLFSKLGFSAKLDVTT